MNANNNQQASGQEVPVPSSTSFTPINAEPVPIPRKRAGRKKAIHRCGIGACDFQTDTPKGVKEHQKNKHLGLECYWYYPADNTFCRFKTATHEDLYEHFNKEHLKKEARQNGNAFVCCWPGMRRLELDDGSIDPVNKCEQKFKQLSGAERHAREHQHKIWCAAEKLAAEKQKLAPESQ
ncbi:hypothetical protein GGR51DRAFT_578373 [Nemania sp. FL0031]|nr:hypothetical protein GGR51DRAFT_578373 [Nemania sp. FL0031]